MIFGYLLNWKTIYTPHFENRITSSGTQYIIRFRQYVSRKNRHRTRWSFRADGTHHRRTNRSYHLEHLPRFSTALSAFVAQNYAARQISRVLKAYRTTLWMTFIFGSFCTFLLYVMETKYFLSLFLKSSLRNRRCLSTYWRILATIYDAGNYHTGRILWDGAHHASCRNQRHL